MMIAIARVNQVEFKLSIFVLTKASCSFYFIFNKQSKIVKKMIIAMIQIDAMIIHQMIYPTVIH